MGLPFLSFLASTTVQVGLHYIAGQVQRDWSKRPRAEEVYPREFDRPASPRGQAIPIVFGTRWIKAPAILWWGDYFAAALQRSGEVVGFNYYIGVHLGICHAPIDAILEIKAGEVTIWPDTTVELTDNSRLYIHKPDIFGGEQGEGGIIGYVDIVMGADDEVENAYLAEGTGFEGDESVVRPLPDAYADYPRIPPYRGVVQAILNRPYVSFNTPQMKPWSFLVQYQGDRVAKIRVTAEIEFETAVLTPTDSTIESAVESGFSTTVHDDGAP